MNFGFTPASTPTPHDEVITPTPVQAVDASTVI
jgi:hypothetical protein